MRRPFAILGSGLFLVIAPGSVAVLVPWWISRWRLQTPLWGVGPIRVVGVLLIAAGLPVLLDSFARFALQGVGTPAPLFPTRHLVVTGLYRYVRNPNVRGGGLADRWPGAAIGQSPRTRVRTRRMARLPCVCAAVRRTNVAFNLRRGI